MTSYGGKELASAFRTVRKNTIQVAEDIPESKYGFVAAPDVRSVGRMLTHVAIATRNFVGTLTKRDTWPRWWATTSFGLLDRFNARKPKPERRRRFSTCCEPRGAGLRRGLETLTPEFLAERVTEPDGKASKSRFERLLGVKEHEMHHRAQLMFDRAATGHRAASDAAVQREGCADACARA